MFKQQTSQPPPVPITSWSASRSVNDCSRSSTPHDSSMFPSNVSTILIQSLNSLRTTNKKNIAIHNQQSENVQTAKQPVLRIIPTRAAPTISSEQRVAVTQKLQHFDLISGHT